MNWRNLIDFAGVLLGSIPPAIALWYFDASPEISYLGGVIGGFIAGRMTA